MCKVTIKEVKKATSKNGSTEGRDWTLYIMDCLISVDGDERQVVRTVKTFEQEIYQRVMSMDESAPLTLEADKQPVGSTYEYLLKKPAAAKFGKKNFNHRVHGGTETNRQRALSMAVELWRARSAEQGVPSDEEILSTADKFVSWLGGQPGGLSLPEGGRS